MHGNLPLIRHILDVGGRDLLELGNEFGFTPLFCAARHGEHEAAECLIAQGADVNRATTLYADSIPSGSTPLWVAAHGSKSVRICKLLLRHGAVAVPEPDESGQIVLDGARPELELERRQVTVCVDTTLSSIVSFGLVPLDMLKIVTEYVYWQ